MFEIYKNFPFTTLFIDGNHDDHNRILTLPTEHMFGSDVGEVIKDKMYHLRRGRIYNIKGYKFLTIGGGLSVDKQYRIENKSWWSGELLNEEDKSKIKKIIEDNNYYTDYIITHVPPQTIINKMEANCLLYNNYNLKEKDPTSIFLENIFALMTFKKWYCGHMHIDYSFFNNSVKCLYNNVVKLPI
jgi:hypothetical protein